jgi:hypothetical protein
VSALADLEQALWQGGYDRLADSHVHRAVCEDSLGITKGRDALQARWIATGSVDVSIAADLGEMIAVKGTGWTLHRWVWLEDARIVREVEISNRDRSLTAPPVHAPIGELRAGRGQFAVNEAPNLPPGFPEAARPLVTALHRLWNGRAFDGDVPAVIRQLVADLPDAVFLFELAIVSAGTAAILFRIMGHHPNGQRIRLIGSYLDSDGVPDVVIDMAAYHAQLAQPVIDYSHP